MPPRKRATPDPSTNGSHGAPAPPAYAEFSDNPRCDKCLSTDVGAEYHAAATTPGQPDRGNNVSGPVPGAPEWLRRICRGCGYSWPEMCADFSDTYWDEFAQAVRDAVNNGGLMPTFGLPTDAITSYLDASGEVVARWYRYNPAELEGLSGWPNVATVEVSIGESVVIVANPRQPAATP